eukprot:gene2714-2964_t
MRVLYLALNEDSLPKEREGDDVLVIGSEEEVEKRVEALDKAIFDEAKAYFLPSETLQGHLFSVIKPKGKLLVEGVPNREVGQELSLNLKIQGFVDVMAAKDPVSGSRFVVSQRPDLQVGSTAQVHLPTKVRIDNLAEEELIDESDLLAETEVDVQNATQDCGTGADGKKRACANCTCGLAEKGEGESKALTEEEKIDKASSCGNCYKGDAFRCASCPFLGMPAFEPGQEKVMLTMVQDV